MPHISTRLVLSQRTEPQQRQVRIHFIWYIYPSPRPQLPSSHRCQYSRNCRLSLSDKIVTLGVTLDSNLTLSNHISNICRSTHYHIRALRHIRPLSGGLSQMTWPRWLPLPLSTHVLIMLTLSSMALQISRNYNVYRTQLLE